MSHGYDPPSAATPTPTACRLTPVSRTCRAPQRSTRKPHDGLADPRRGVEDRHHQAQRHVRHVKGIPQDGKQRRQGELDEVAGEVRQPDEGHDGGVAPRARRGSRIKHGSGRAPRRRRARSAVGSVMRSLSYITGDSPPSRDSRRRGGARAASTTRAPWYSPLASPRSPMSVWAAGPGACCTRSPTSRRLACRKGSPVPGVGSDHRWREPGDDQRHGSGRDRCSARAGRRARGDAAPVGRHRLLARERGHLTPLLARCRRGHPPAVLDGTDSFPSGASGHGRSWAWTPVTRCWPWHVARRSCSAPRRRGTVLMCSRPRRNSPGPRTSSTPARAPCQGFSTSGSGLEPSRGSSVLADTSTCSRATR